MLHLTLQLYTRMSHKHDDIPTHLSVKRHAVVTLVPAAAIDTVISTSLSPDHAGCVAGPRHAGCVADTAVDVSLF